MRIIIRMIAINQTTEQYLSKIQAAVENEQIGRTIYIESAPYWKESLFIETTVRINSAQALGIEEMHHVVKTIFDESRLTEYDNLPVSYEIEHYEQPDAIEQGKIFWCVSFENDKNF